MSNDQSQSLGAGLREAAIVPVYCYVIRHTEDDAFFYLTAWDHAIIIDSLPAALGSGTQTFQPGQCRHGPTQQKADFSTNATEFTVWTEDARLRAYFLTAAATKITIYCIRLASSRAVEPGATFDWTRDAQITASGLLGMVSMSGAAITATLTPEPHLANSQIAALAWQRTCNWTLYGPGCGLNRATYAHSTTIDSLDASARMITLFTSPSASATYFRDGYVKHMPSGVLLPIAQSDLGGAGGKTRLTLNFWFAQLSAGDALTAYPGCRHTVADCHSKFNNKANFGGFPAVPNRNPVIHGVI